MRFEEMEHQRQINTLRRFHRSINRDVFNGSLKEIAVDVANTNKGEQVDNIAVFKPHTIVVDGKTMEAYIGEKICFAYEFVDIIAKLKTQREQAGTIAATMLHEMIHQYCYENGLDDTEHGGEWEAAARQHGLISIYRDGNLISEDLEPVTGAILSFYRL